MTITSTFLGRPVLLLPPDLDASSVQRQHTMDSDEFVGDAGERVQRSKPSLPNFSTSVTWLCQTRAQWDDLEQFLRSRAGKCYSFWIPSWNDDVWVRAAGFFDVLIDYAGYTANYFPQEVFRKFLMVDRTNPYNWWPRFIGSSVDNGDGTETISGAIGFPYPGGWTTAASDTVRYMIPYLVRLDSDDLEIEYLTGEAVQVTASIFHVPDEGL